MPKPLIRVNGKSLLQHAMESFNLEDYDAVYIIGLERNCLRQNLMEDQFFAMHRSKINWFDIKNHLNGQLLTLCKAIEYINPKGAGVVHNCDTSFQRIPLSVIDHKNKNIFGCIPWFESKGENWSFLRKTAFDEVIEVKEKKRISRYCSVGTYYFRDLLSLTAIADEYITSGMNELGEFYIAPLYDFAISLGLKVYCSEVKGVKVFGNPKELHDSFDLNLEDIEEIKAVQAIANNP